MGVVKQKIINNNTLQAAKGRDLSTFFIISFDTRNEWENSEMSWTFYMAYKQQLLTYRTSLLLLSWN